MNRIEGFITAHIGDSINECDDNFAYNLDKCNFAIADGSSSDFFSNIYSRMLSDNYVEDPVKFYNEENIKDINLRWRSVVREKLEETGCKPGSFPFVRFQRMDPGCSTLIGLNFFKDDEGIKYRCSGLGDSVLFFKPEHSNVPTLQFFSYSNEEFSLDQSVEFGYTPVISRSYSTQWIGNVKNYSNFLSKGIFFLMTDGMAEWILRSDNGPIEDKFKELDNIHSQEEFLIYVEKIRKNGAHNDDMTLLKIYVDDVIMHFDAEHSIIYDYRTEQDEIETQEAQKLEEQRLEEEKKAQEQKLSQTTKNSLNWIAGVIAGQKKHNEEETKKEIIKRQSRSDDHNRSLIQAAQAKIKEEKKHKEDDSNDTVSKEMTPAAPSTIKSPEYGMYCINCGKEIENVEGLINSTTEKVKEQCELEKDQVVEDATQKAKEQGERELEEAICAAKTEKDEEYKNKEEERLKKEEADNERKTKQPINILKNHYPWLIIILLIGLLASNIISQEGKNANISELETIDKYISKSKEDSLKISTLEKTISQKDKIIETMESDVVVYNKRFDYIKDKCPKTYPKMMNIKQ